MIEQKLAAMQESVKILQTQRNQAFDMLVASETNNRLLDAQLKQMLADHGQQVAAMQKEHAAEKEKFSVREAELQERVSALTRVNVELESSILNLRDKISRISTPIRGKK